MYQKRYKAFQKWIDMSSTDDFHEWVNQKVQERTERIEETSATFLREFEEEISFRIL